MQRKLFIASSSDGLSYASALKVLLSDEFEVVLWNETFRQNTSAFDNLVNTVHDYDYALFLFTPDDARLSRETNTIIPRDNVVFEAGLFLGALGRQRIFLLAKEGVQLPSDYLGITHISFTDAASLSTAMLIIKKHIVNTQSQSEFGFLPSTALALGYFNNFILLVCEALQYNPNVKGRDLSGYHLQVLLPNSLDANIPSLRAMLQLKELRIKTPKRSFPLFIQSKLPKGKAPLLTDVPTTLITLKAIIRKYLDAQTGSTIGPTLNDDYMEARELANFKKTLEYLIREHPITRNSVSVRELYSAI